MKVLDKPEGESQWTVVIDSVEHPDGAGGSSHEVNGYAELRQLLDRYPDAVGASLGSRS